VGWSPTIDTQKWTRVVQSRSNFGQPGVHRALIIACRWLGFLIDLPDRSLRSFGKQNQVKTVKHQSNKKAAKANDHHPHENVIHGKPPLVERMYFCQLPFNIFEKKAAQENQSC
jgi:hypothetical protein